LQVLDGVRLINALTVQVKFYFTSPVRRLIRSWRGLYNKVIRTVV
jgi:hypothetical protein